MNTAETIAAIRLVIDALNAAHLAGVDFDRLGSLFDRARAEGREITDAEIAELAGVNDAALAELDSAIAARELEDGQ